MNIIYLNPSRSSSGTETKALYDRMDNALKRAHVDFEKSIRIAKTLAPILSDQSSNEKHLATINSSSSLHEKVIAILMLGFPKNKVALPTLQKVLQEGSEAMRIAAAISISQMRDSENNELLSAILLAAQPHEHSRAVKRALRQAVRSLKK
jgi:hypothetical protein